MFFAATPIKDQGDGIAGVSAIFRRGRWIIAVRQDDQYAVLNQRPEIVRNVLGMDLDISDLPELMRQGFRWRAHSEWVPRTTDTASQIYFDYCPDDEFPIFRGTST
ncbi:MAG: hypothetical protein QOH26_1931 [Actinomycetota bacterium]|jgi:hypothetical protein|nr:hypothetical protein [Actinomycetota bacterium]